MALAARLFLVVTLALAQSACVGHLINEVDGSDPAIKARLESALRAEKGIDTKTLTLDVHSRVVTISGLVGSFEERAALIRVANSIKGVEQLVLNVVIQDQ